MRVEVTFSGDSIGAQHATDQVNDALRKLILTAKATGVELGNVKITSGQAAESIANTRAMKSEVESLGTSARRTRDDLLSMRVSAGGLSAGGSLIAAGIAAAVPLVGPVSGAAAAGLAALPGLAAAGSAAVGVLVLSFKGLGSALGGNKAAFEALNAPAQEFVQTLRSLDGFVDSLTKTAQGGLFPGLSAGLHDALTPANAQALQAAIGGIAASLGQVGEEFGKSVGSPAFTQGFGELMQHSAVWTGELGDATLQLASAMAKLSIAALPLTDWLVKAIDDGARLTNQWTGAGLASGELAKGLASARQELELVARFVEALGEAVFSLAAALTPLGNDILVGVTHALQGLSTWVDKNRQQISDFTTSALHGLEAILGVIVPLVLDLAKAINEVVTATTGWKTAFEVITTVYLVNAIAGVSGLRLGLLALGSPEVLAAIGAAGLAFASFEAGKAVASWITGPTSGPNGPQGHAGLVQLPSGKWVTAAEAKTTTTPFPAGSPGGPPSAAAAAAVSPSTTAAAQTYIKSAAASFGLDPAALIGVANNESANWSGKPGDNNTSFGPFQMHLGGAFPQSVWQAALKASPGDPAAYANAWAWSPAGISYALNAIAASGARGLTGTAAVSAIVTGFEKPASTVADLAAGDAAVKGEPAGVSPFGTPPPFTATTATSKTGGAVLPQSIQLAMALATTTGPATDNLKAAREAVAWLQAQIKGGAFKGQDLIDAANELGSLLQQVNQLKKTINPIKKPAKPPALATQASALSAQTAADAILKTLNTNVFAATAPGKQATDTQSAMNDALKALTAAQATYEPKIEAIQAEISKGLANKTLTAADLATLRAKMSAYGQTITTAVQNAQTAVQAQQASFQSIWQTMASDAVDAFNAESDKFVPPAQVLLNQLQDQQTQTDLQNALDQANQQMADAMNTVDNQAVVDSIKQTIGQYASANAVDTIQSAVLGGTASFMSGGGNQSLLTALQQQLIQNTVPDATAVAQAQQAINDAQLAIQENGLAAQATQQQDAYNDMRTAQLQVLTQMGSDWTDYYNQVGGNINAIKALWVAALGAVDPTAAANLNAGVDAVGQDVGAGPEGTTGTTAPAAAVAAATAAAAQAAQQVVLAGGASSFQWGGITWTNGEFNQFVSYLASTGVDYSVWANNHPLAASIFGRDTISLHAAGGIAMRPTFITSHDVMGEAGREALVPLDSPTGKAALRDAVGGGSSGETHIHVHGNIPPDWIQVQIDKATPRISRNLGQRTAGRLKSHSY